MGESNLNNLHDVDFERYVQYDQLTRFIAILQKSVPRLRVLDLQGYSQGGIVGSVARLETICSDLSSTVLNTGFNGSDSDIISSIVTLPFRNRSFDLVVLVDTLEHIPPNKREFVVREACRVADKAVFLAGPVDDERTVNGEKLLHQFIRNVSGSSDPNLEEHLNLGLPGTQTLTKWFPENGYSGIHFPCGSLWEWLFKMTLKTTLLQSVTETDSSLRDLNRLFNLPVGGPDTRLPSYFHIFMYIRSDMGIDLEGLRLEQDDSTVKSDTIRNHELGHLLFFLESARLHTLLNEVYAIQPSRHDLTEFIGKTERLITEKDALIERHLLMLKHLEEKMAFKNNELEGKDHYIARLETENRELTNRVDELKAFKNELNKSKLYKIIKPFIP